MICLVLYFEVAKCTEKCKCCFVDEQVRTVFHIVSYHIATSKDVAVRAVERVINSKIEYKLFILL
jgi:hypothetical protein